MELAEEHGHLPRRLGPRRNSIANVTGQQPPPPLGCQAEYRADGERGDREHDVLAHERHRDDRADEPPRHAPLATAVRIYGADHGNGAAGVIHILDREH